MPSIFLTRLSLDLAPLVYTPRQRFACSETASSIKGDIIHAHSRAFTHLAGHMSFASQILPDHHQHCDTLFVAAEEAAQGGDWATAKAAFSHFNMQMQAHFDAEEGVLFPAFEAATGMASGPTQMMRLEHQQMRSLLAQLELACTEEDADGYAGAAETLLMLMQQHNMKEENILYPMCDQALASEAGDLGARIGAMLEKRSA